MKCTHDETKAKKHKTPNRKPKTTEAAEAAETKNYQPERPLATNRESKTKARK